MNYLCTLFVGSNKIGTIMPIPDSLTDTPQVKISGNTEYMLCDIGSGSKVSLHPVDNRVPDEALRTLSYTRYIVIERSTVIIDGKIYSTFGTLPIQCQFKVLPVIKYTDIIDYEANDNDTAFVNEGYVRELKEAELVLVPPSPSFHSKNCAALDLLIKKREGDTLVSFSGRKTQIPTDAEIDGRYVYLYEIPVFTGDFKDKPYTWTIASLRNKCQVLQDRLQKYGSDRVDSLCASMKSMPERLKNIPNQFKASTLYPDVVTFLEKMREME